MIHWTRFKKSIQYALHGLSLAWEEQNFRIQTGAAILVLFFAWFFRVTRTEIFFLLLVSLIVLVLELVNTIFERFTDFFSPRYSTAARAVKDLMAAAVLVSSLGALAIGVIIFWPYLL